MRERAGAQPRPAAHARARTGQGQVHCLVVCPGTPPDEDGGAGAAAHRLGHRCVRRCASADLRALRARINAPQGHGERPATLKANVPAALWLPHSRREPAAMAGVGEPSTFWKSKNSQTLSGHAHCAMQRHRLLACWLTMRAVSDTTDRPTASAWRRCGPWGRIAHCAADAAMARGWSQGTIAPGQDQWPVKRAGRFSRKCATPSLKSALRTLCDISAFAASVFSASVWKGASYCWRLITRMERGETLSTRSRT